MPYNPFARWPITGTWEDHASYSAGGTDYPLPIGTDLPAPAAGTLRTSGGSGEFAAGYIGSAGRRSILMLDTPIERVLARKTSPNEGEGPMVAIVFQHQSIMGVAKHYVEGEDLGDSGDSDGTSDGGDDHLHIHGLNANGQRLRFESFITTGSATAGLGSTTILTTGDSDMPKIHTREDNKRSYFITPQRIMHIADAKEFPGLRYSCNYADKNKAINEQIGKDDFRIVIQAYGFNYDKVAALKPGESLDLAGNRYPRNVWPGAWA